MLRSTKMYETMGEGGEEAEDREAGVIPDLPAETKISGMTEGCLGKQFVSVLACFVAAVVGILIFSAVLTAWGVGADKDKEHDHPLPTDAKQTSFCTPPIVVLSGQHLEWDSIIPRETTGFPSDKHVFIQSVDLHIRDRRGRNVPLQQIYNHHTFLMSSLPDGSRFQTLAGYGAERVKVTYGHSKGILLQPDAVLFANGEWLDVFGRLATINQTVAACFDVVYIPTDNEEDINAYINDPLIFGLFGTSHNGGDFEFAIPPSLDNGATCMSSESPWRYDSIEVVYVLGHVHIGALNQSLIDESSGKTLVAAYPHYDSSGYIDDIHTEINPERLLLTNGTTYKTTACYQNRDQGYARVMSLWGVIYRNLDNPGTMIWFDDSPEDKRSFRFS